MKKHLLLLLTTLLGAVQTVCAQEIYAALDFTQQATIYYDDQKDARYGENMGFGNLYGKFNYVTNVVFDASVKNYHPGSLATWFQNWTSLRTFEHLDYLNTENVVTMQGMFHNCRSLESLNLSSFNTPKLTNMEGMFAYCTELRSVNLSSFNTSEVTDMSGLFAECTSLTSVNISSFNTAKVTNMSSMFYNCESLQEVDVSHFKTTALTNMMSMFENCSMLYNLDLSEANTSAVTDMSHLFYNCEVLNTIYADEAKWSTTAVTESTDMFKNCYNLCGHGSEYGTCYEYAKVVDATYARVDGNSTPGYLTQKNGPSGGNPEPYAVLLGDNTRLVFCYDGNKESRGGLDIGPFTAESTCWGGHAADITEVSFQEDFANARPTSTAYWFKGMEKLENIQGLAYLNTSEVTDMSYMFANMKGLYELSLSTLNTAKVTSMKGMFSGCSLREFNGSKFNTQNVTDMSYMFADSEIDYCNFRNFNTENVTNMSYMFRNLNDIYTLDLIYFNTSKVTNMEEMFYGCYALSTIYVDEDCWSTAAVTNSTNMFYECSNLKGSKGTRYDDEHYDAEYARVDKADQPGYLSAKDPSAYAALSNENTVLTFYYDNKKDKRGGMSIGPFYYNMEASWYSHRATLKEVVFDSSFAEYKSLISTRSWFKHCKFTSITGIENLNTEKVTDMHQMFYNCSALESIDLSHFSTASAVIMSDMFYNCKSLKSLDVSGFDTSNVTDMSSMFNWCSGLTSLDLNTFKTDKVKNMNTMFSNCKALQTIYNDNTWTCSQSNNMFKDCTSLKGAIEYDASKIDVTYANPETGYFTSKTTPAEPEPYAVLSNDNTVLTFYYDDQKTARNGMDVGPFTSSWVSDINRWNVSSGWDAQRESITSVVFDASFAGCTTLTSTAYLFYGFKSLSSITGIGNLKTDNVTDMHSMFYDCSSLTSLDVSGFKTDKVTRMYGMFSGCSSLTSLDVTGFKTDNVTRMEDLFSGCSGLKTIYAGDGWSTAKVQNGGDMFKGCTSLVGGAGTTYDANYTDHTYAHIDGGTSNPGYFTQKGGPAMGSCDMSEVPTDNDFYAATSFLCERGVLDGSKVDGKYLVEKELLRQHLANITFRGLFTLKGREIPSTFVSDQYPAIYDDLKSDAPYYQAAKTLLYLDYGDHITPFDRDRDGFFPDNNESRINILKELMEAFNIKPDMEGTDNPFPNEADIAQLSETSPIKMGYVRQAAKLGIITTENEQFRPYKECLRGEAFLMLAHIIQKIEAGEIADPNPQESDFLDPNSGTGTAEPYAVYNNGTLTFYYDGKKTERGGYDVGPFDSNSTRWGGHLSEINKVIFDDSFAECTTLTSTAHWFEDFSGSESISFTGINNLKTDNVTDMSYMFYSCKAKNIDVSGFNTEKVTTMEKMFDDCGATALDVSNFKTDNVTSMRSMFESCSNLTSLDLSNFNTENVTDMSSMFYADGGLENLNISGFKTGNVTTMNSMFAYCKKLEQIDVSHFETSSVQNMLQMFCNCKGLTSIDVSNFNTEKVGVMQSMFNGCSALTQIDVSHFNTSQVKYMNHMFADCKGITSIDVSNFNIANVQEMKSLFSGCSSLTTIYSDATWFCSYSPNMFLDCTSLVGGAGTTYDANHVDVNYARIDGGTDAPGYFTSTSAMPKICAKPVISMKDGRLVYDCTTEGVTYKSTISKSYNSSSITLKDTYILSVYAIKDGYENSEAATVEIQMRSPGKKGDVDEDGVVDIADAVRIVNYVVGKVDALAPRHEMNLQDPE